MRNAVLLVLVALFLSACGGNTGGGASVDAQIRALFAQFAEGLEEADAAKTAEVVAPQVNFGGEVITRAELEAQLESSFAAFIYHRVDFIAINITEHSAGATATATYTAEIEEIATGDVDVTSTPQTWDFEEVGGSWRAVAVVAQ